MSVLSHERVEPGSVNIPPAKFPPTASTPKDSIDAYGIASTLITSLNSALAKKDYQSAANLFLDYNTTDNDKVPGFWRDHLCLSWDLRTLKGREKIASFLKEASTSHLPLSIEIDRSSAFRSPQVLPIDGVGVVWGIHFFGLVSTKFGSGRAIVRLAEVDDEHGKPGQKTWKIFTLFTSLDEIKGHEENMYSKRPLGAHHGENTHRKNWQDRRNAEVNYEGGREPTVLILGRFFFFFLACSLLCMARTDHIVIQEPAREASHHRLV